MSSSCTAATAAPAASSTTAAGAPPPPQEQAPQDEVLANGDLLDGILLFLDYHTLLLGPAFVSKYWKSRLMTEVKSYATCNMIPASTPAFEQQVFRPAFWKYFKAQDETFPNSICCQSWMGDDFEAVNDRSTRSPKSWLGECKKRRLESRTLWPDDSFSTDRIECQELKGDVLFTVGNTGSKDYVVCAGEAGQIYFVEQELEVEYRRPVMKFMYKAHDATIYALHLRKEIKMEVRTDMPGSKTRPYRRFRVLSGDAIGRVRMDMVDPDKEGRSNNGTVTPVKDFVVGPTAVLQMAWLTPEVVATALRDGRICLWTEAMMDVPAEMTTIQAHQGDVTHMAVLDDGEGHTRIVVTASNDEQTLRTWGLCSSAATGGGASDAAMCPVSLTPLQQLDLQSVDIPALMCSTGMGVYSGESLVVLGFGNGKLCVIDVQTCQVKEIIPAHTDEIWDVKVYANLVATTSRSRKIAIHRLNCPPGKPSCLLRYDKRDWMVRIKFTPSHLVLVGFDAVIYSVVQNAGIHPDDYDLYG